MKSWFLEGGYSKQMTDSRMGKVKFGQRLKAGSKQKGFGVPLVITYHPRLKKITQIVKNLEHLLYQDESVKRVFIPPPIVSYRSARKLSSYLVRSKLYPLERKIGSNKCDNFRCLVCNNIEETDTFTSAVRGASFKINHHLCCDDKYIQGKQLIDLDYDATTIKKAIGNS